MISFFNQRIFAFIVVILFSSDLTLASMTNSSVSFINPVIREPFKNAASTAAYVTISNKGNEKIFINRVLIPSASTMIHKTLTSDNGIVKMEHLMNLPIPAKTTIVFKPGGLHIMLIDLKKTFKSGDLIPSTIIFNNAKGQKFRADISFKVVEKIKKDTFNKNSKHVH